MEGNILRIRVSEADSFAEQVLALKNILYSIAKSYLHSEQDALDAVQEAIVQSWQSRNRLRDPNAFKPWLIRILINTCKNQLRRKLPTTELFDMPDTDARKAEEILDIRRAMAALDEKTRLCAILFYYEDMPMQKIAETLDIPLGTVKSRLHRARLQLRTALEVYADE